LTLFAIHCIQLSYSSDRPMTIKGRLQRTFSQLLEIIL